MELVLYHTRTPFKRPFWIGWDITTDKWLHFHTELHEHETLILVSQSPYLILTWHWCITETSRFKVYCTCSLLAGSTRVPLQMGSTEPPSATTHLPVSDVSYSTFRSKRWRSNGHDATSVGGRGVSWHPEIAGRSSARSSRIQTWIWIRFSNQGILCLYALCLSRISCLANRKQCIWYCRVSSVRKKVSSVLLHLT